MRQKSIHAHAESKERYSALRDIERWYRTGHCSAYPLETLVRLVKTLERAEARYMAQERKHARSVMQRRVATTKGRQES